MIKFIMSVDSVSRKKSVSLKTEGLQKFAFFCAFML